MQLLILVLLGSLWVQRKKTQGQSSTSLEPFIRSMFDAQNAVMREELSRQREETQRIQSLHTETTERRFHHLSASLSAEQFKFAEARTQAERNLREETQRSLQELGDRFRTHSQSIQETQEVFRAQFSERFEQLTEKNTRKHIELQSLLSAELAKLREGNEAKLEKMRETVDEKLQGTLEKRLGESFQLVSSRLEEVHKGLGEMQSLASDVGGLKRVLTNVKSRGTWGEVQLARQLEDLLSPEQYESNVAIKPHSAERVEFAVKLPGREENGEVVYLPIDSKFPQEDYERLVEATELGDKDSVELAAKALEKAIIEQAKTIASKYIEAPYSTDFAIMYLPTEGLFAEVIRRPGLVSRLQNEHRINVTGPTTLSSLLNSLQMGFRTLAIEKRSSEVWSVLGQAKQEFRKYGAVWEKLEKQLATAQNTVKEAGTRTRAVERKLRSVETSMLDTTQEPPALDVALAELTNDE